MNIKPYGKPIASDMVDLDNSDNWTSVKSTLIQYAGRNVLYYACDVVHDIISLQNHINDILAGEDEPEPQWFGFRECGVDHKEYILQRDHIEYKKLLYLDIVQIRKGDYPRYELRLYRAQETA